MTKTDSEMIDEMNDLGPWHMAISLNDRVSSGMTEPVDMGKYRSPSLIDKELGFKELIGKAYPNGLGGRTFADHACNAGGYCFWAKDLGADQTFGYDVREHWIDQAKYVRDNREADTSDMTFDVLDIYDMPSSVYGSTNYDVSWFSGIFYHLPDPVTALKLVADRTTELLYISTATQNLLDPEPEKGALFGSYEGTEYVMTGVHGLNWFPSGPNCLANILRWCGFKATKVVTWHKQVVNHRRPGDKAVTVGRLEMVAARKAGMLRGFEEPVILESTKLDWENRGQIHLDTGPLSPTATPGVEG